MRSFLSITCSTAFLVALLPGIAAAQSAPECGLFTRNLALGASGADVRALQVFLNTDTRTKVSLDGPGSPGNETTYFGMKTKAAVVKFQELHRAEVLTPVGLTSGSGFVGTFSRAKIAALCAKGPGTSSTIAPTTPATPVTGTTSGRAPTGRVPSNSTVTTPVTPTTPTTPSSPAPTVPVNTSSGFSSEELVLMYPSTYAAPRGATVSIAGLGFTSGKHTVYLGATTIANATVLSGMISFVIPETAALGAQSLWVTNEKGESNKLSFTVTQPNAVAPTITSISPKEGFQGTTITITGTGFTPTGNQVHTSREVIDNVASPDGKTLQVPITITVDYDPEDEGPTEQIATGYDDPEFNIRDPFGISVMNVNGMSNTEVFYFKL